MKNVVIKCAAVLQMFFIFVSTANAVFAERDNIADNLIMYNILYDISDNSKIVEPEPKFTLKNTELESVVFEITKDCASDYEKINKIYEWVSKNICYDQSFYSEDHVPGSISKHPDDVFENKYTTCTGFANLCVKMCNIVGIPCTRLCIYSPSAADEGDDVYETNHSMNAAYDGNRWILFDARMGGYNNKYENGIYTYGKYLDKYFDIAIDSQRLNERRLLYYTNDLPLKDGRTYAVKVTAEGITMTVKSTEVPNDSFHKGDVIFYHNYSDDISNLDNIKKGDVLSDDKVNSKDLVKLSQFVAKWNINMKAREEIAADIVTDGLINSKDSIKLAQYLAKWNVSLE